MLQRIRSELDYDNTDYHISRDPVLFHNLHAIDEPSLYLLAESIDPARHHFRSWIPENIKARLRPEATDLSDIRYNYLVYMTPRYKYCLYVDDLCIESMDQDGVHVPVVKILDKAWEPYMPEELKELEESEDLGVMVPGRRHPARPVPRWLNRRLGGGCGLDVHARGILPRQVFHAFEVGLGPAVREVAFYRRG
ncbi:hypothetical protein E4U09_007192 [Claviceps aff. purpurea]|uniref:Uncharacterized protein n=1 Tax=Claviceps aff. purpurea TaxID=1967640 RepID=A0A9P7QAA4_9HYPO|nr:hypothetical protein E4U09_007192 [Claviceps aff. purpurea]